MHFAERLRRLLFPPKCAACGALLHDYLPERALCKACGEKWKNEELETCGICTKRVYECRCVTEEMRKAKCTAFCKLIYYRHGTGDAVQNRVLFHLKRERDRELVDFLCEKLVSSVLELQREDPDGFSESLICYIPRGRIAKLESGTDQAEELARSLSRLCGIPHQNLIARNRGKDLQQKRLSPTRRLQNARESFRLRGTVDLTGKTVYLVDDIVTTGAGMAVCARLLRRAGARRIYCLAVASDDQNKDRLY